MQNMLNGTTALQRLQNQAAIQNATTTASNMDGTSSPIASKPSGSQPLPDPTPPLPSLADQAAALNRLAAMDRARDQADLKEKNVSSAVAYALCQRLDIQDMAQLVSDISLNLALIDRVFNNIGFHAKSGRIWMMTPSGKLVECKETELAMMVLEHYGPLFHHSEHKKLIAASQPYQNTPSDKQDRFLHETLGLPIKTICNKAKAHRQFSNFKLRVDIFATEGSATLCDGKLVLQFIHRPFPVGPIDRAVVDDYLAHFPELDDFIILLACCRFASSRKQAHLWCHAPSDWGKSLLMGILGTLGLVVETSASELEKMMSGGPVGRTLDEFVRCWVLAIDEFKGVIREMKQLSTEINYAPKNMPTVKALLYLKLFLSAEHAESLASNDSGIEDQFANRFMYLRLQGCLDSRPLLQESRTHYKLTLVSYFAERLNTIVEEYRALGPVKAADKADQKLRELYEKYAISNTFRRLSDALGDLAEQFITDVIDAYKRNDVSRATEFQKFARPYVEEVTNHGLCLRSPKKVLEKWINTDFNRAGGGKLLYKQDQIIAAIGEIKGIRHGDSTFKGLVIRPAARDKPDQSTANQTAPDTSANNEALDLEFEF